MKSSTRIALLALTASLPLLHIPGAHAATEYLVMSAQEEVWQKCKNDLPSQGVACTLDGRAIGGEAQWIKVTENLSQDEWAAGVTVSSVLQLVTRTTSSGIPYLTATNYQTTSQTPNKKETRFGGTFWKTIRAQLYTKPIDDPIAVQFLKDANDKPTAEQLAARESATKEAEARKYADSPEAQRNMSADLILDCDLQIKEAREVIAYEKKVGATSGFVNKVNLRQAGEQIVRCQEDMKEYWGDYKANGGKSRSVEQLRKERAISARF